MEHKEKLTLFEDVRFHIIVLYYLIIWHVVLTLWFSCLIYQRFTTVPSTEDIRYSVALLAFGTWWTHEITFLKRNNLDYHFKKKDCLMSHYFCCIYCPRIYCIKPATLLKSVPKTYVSRFLSLILVMFGAIQNGTE